MFSRMFLSLCLDTFRFVYSVMSVSQLLLKTLSLVTVHVWRFFVCVGEEITDYEKKQRHITHNCNAKLCWHVVYMDCGNIMQWTTFDKWCNGPTPTVAFTLKNISLEAEKKCIFLGATKSSWDSCCWRIMEYAWMMKIACELQAMPNVSIE